MSFSCALGILLRYFGPYRTMVLAELHLLFGNRESCSRMVSLVYLPAPCFLLQAERSSFLRGLWLLLQIASYLESTEAHDCYNRQYCEDFTPLIAFSDDAAPLSLCSSSSSSVPASCDWSPSSTGSHDKFSLYALAEVASQHLSSKFCMKYYARTSCFPSASTLDFEDSR